MIVKVYFGVSFIYDFRLVFKNMRLYLRNKSLYIQMLNVNAMSRNIWTAFLVEI